MLHCKCTVTVGTMWWIFSIKHNFTTQNVFANTLTFIYCLFLPTTLAILRTHTTLSLKSAVKQSLATHY